MANLLLREKVAFIAGAANKFGDAIARKFVKQGATVFLAGTDLDHESCKAIAAKITEEADENNAEAHGIAHAVDCRVSDSSDILRAIKEVMDKPTIGKLDIFYNNVEVTDESSIASNAFNTTMAVNAQAVLKSIKYAGGVMNGGCILCTGSTMGMLGDVVPSAYSISKTTVLSLIRAAAAELASKGVRVNAISPASFDPQRMPKALWCPPSTIQNLLEGMIDDYKKNPVSGDDVADAAVFLASEYGKSVNGHNLVLSGKFPLY